MAAGTIQVKVSAEVSGFAKDMQRATREVDQFAHHVDGMGKTLARGGMAATQMGSNVSMLGQILPGATGGIKTFTVAAGSAVTTLGLTSLALGEVTEASGRLTKAWALISVAGKQLAATGAEVLASLGPIGWTAIIVAGVLGTLAYAYHRVGEEARLARGHVLQFEMIEPRHMPFSEMTGRQAHLLEPVTASAIAPSSDATMKVVQYQANLAIDEWKQAVAQIRPITSTIATDWQSAMSAVNAALSDTTKRTKDEVAELYRLRAALRDVKSIALQPLSSSDFSKINGPSATRLQSLSPRDFLGPLMDATPTSLGLETPKKVDTLTMVTRAGFQQLVDSISTVMPLRLSALLGGNKPGSSIGAALGGSFGSGAGAALALSHFGAIGAGSSLGAIIGSAAFPIIGSIAGALLGSALGGIFGKHRQEPDRAADALLKMAQAAERVTESFTNLPTGIKLAGYRFNASDPDPVTGETRSDRHWASIYIAELKVSAQDAGDFIGQMMAAAESTAARGGVSGLTITTSRAARGV